MPVSPSGTAYELAGPADRPLVVLIHGIGVHRRIWRDYIPVLADKYRVLAYDFLGHGESIPAPEPLSLTGLAVQLDTLMTELGLEHGVIAGFSMGGMINRRFAMDFPLRTRGLVVLNSPHQRSPEAQELVEQRVRDTAAGGPGATLQAALVRWFTPDYMDSDPDVVAEVSQWVLANDPGVFTQARMLLATGVLELIRPEPPINCPTLVMTCEHDSGSTPDMAHAIAADIKGAETVIVPGLQHLGMMEQPKLFLDPLLAFLQKYFK